jgi:hypothetical protein
MNARSTSQTFMCLPMDDWLARSGVELFSKSATRSNSRVWLK